MDLDSKIEAILFLLGEPVKVKYLAGILECPEEEVRNALLALNEKLENRGISLMQKDGEVMISTSPTLSELTEKVAQEEYEASLTKPMLEVLAVILYKCPISKQKIDYIRGVNSAFTIRNLLVRGFIEKEKDGESGEFEILYKPSFKLLRHLGARSISELPDYNIFMKKINEYLENDSLNF